MLKVIAAYYVHPTFAAVSSLVFAALLLSAVNTALGDLVSIQFMLSRDKELPHAFAGLNRFGMPVLPLVVAAIVPAVVLLLFPEVEALADLYAVGVVGAIGINLGSTSTTWSLPLKRWERAIMLLLTLIMAAIEATILIYKPHARDFALIVLVLGLAGRLGTIALNKAVPISAAVRRSYLGFAVASAAVVLGLAMFVGDRAPWVTSGLSAAVALGVGYASYRMQGYREALIAAEAAPPAVARPRMMQPGAYTPKERVMVATTGNPRLIDFALRECKSRQAELMLLFVRHLAVTPMGPTPVPTLAEDVQANELFERVREQASEAGVPLRLLYGVARDIPDAILDMAVTHGADLLLLGTTRRGTLWRAMKGDVIQGVAEHLPEAIGLLIHA
jgi:nucleotide-binding universal stress UspA family protein